MKLHNRPINTYSFFLKRTILWVVIMVFPIVATFFFSKTAHAGLFSFMNSLLGGEQVSANIALSSSVYNLSSQNIALLQAHANINPTIALTDETIPLDGKDTLLPDIAANNVVGFDSESVQISTYMVRSGDTLSGIAKMFNVSINTIVWANDISRTAPLQAGQNLIILPVSGIRYTVKKGDTVTSIVSKYKTENKADLDIKEVLRFNDLSLSSALTVGQTIIIPNAEPSSGSLTQSSSSRGRLKVAPNEPVDVPWWTWPILSSYFEIPIAGANRSQGLHGHNAIDFAAPVGTPIYASASGIVIISRSNNGWNGGYGNFVVISHPNGTQTLYSHMSKTSVPVGTHVSKGQTIGYIGVTGLTTGPHVHFEIRGAQNPF